LSSTRRILTNTWIRLSIFFENLNKIIKYNYLKCKFKEKSYLKMKPHNKIFSTNIWYQSSLFLS